MDPLEALSWEFPRGKAAQLLTTPDLVAPWQPFGLARLSDGSPEQGGLPSGGRGFFRLHISDVDTDGDGLTDYEEGLIGFDPVRNNSRRSATADLARAVTGLTGSNTITVGIYDETTSERSSEA